MSISITATPQPLAFAGCLNNFTIQSSGHIIPGTTAQISFTIDTSSATYGETVTLIVDSNTVTFLYDNPDTPISNPAIGPNYRFSTAQQLFALLSTTYYLSGFTVTGTSQSTTRLSPVIQASSPGYHLLSISSSGSIITINGIPSTGRDSRPISNYRVAVRFQVDSPSFTGYTPWCYYTPADGITTVDTSILAPYLPAPSLPSSVTTFQPYAIPAPYIRYRLQAAEFYGTSPVIQSQSTSSWLRLLPGEASQHLASQLLPDWSDTLPATSISSRLLVFGSDTGRTVPLFRGQLDYLYLVTFSADTTATAVVTLRSEHSGTFTYRRTLTLTRDTFHALPVNPALLGATPANCTLSLTILNASGTSIFTRHYTLHHTTPATLQLYYADKYGLLRSFIAATLQRAVSFEADSLTISRARTQQVTKRTEAYTLTTLPLPEPEADRLADSLPFDKLYIHLASSLYPVHVSPSTFQAYTTAQNLSTLTFDIFIQSHQLHPMPHSFRIDPTASPFTPQVYIPDHALLAEDNSPLATELLEILVAQ